MTTQELTQFQQTLDYFRGERELAVTVSYEDWMKETTLGMFHARDNEMDAIGQALKNYHARNKNKQSFVALNSAFENWVRAHERAHKSWTNSQRNTTGIITKLHDQLGLVEAGRRLEQYRDPKDTELRNELVKAEQTALARLFGSRTLGFKDDLLTANLSSAINTFLLPAVSVRSALNSTRAARVSPDQPKSAPEALDKILGTQKADNLFSQMHLDYDKFKAAAGHLVSLVKAPAALLFDIYSLAKQINQRLTVNRERVMFKRGDADAALDAIIRIIDRDIAVVGIDMVKQAGNIAASVFAPGIYQTAANAIIDCMVNMRLYSIMANEMAEGNRLLRDGHYSADVFNASPLLGCYFLVMADTSVWINYSVWDIGTPDWQLTVEAMKKRADPVLDKARQLIRLSKYALSGTRGFKGLEWEANWRNNKLEIIASLVGTRADRIGAADLRIRQVVNLQ